MRVRRCVLTSLQTVLVVGGLVSLRLFIFMPAVPTRKQEPDQYQPEHEQLLLGDVQHPFPSERVDGAIFIPQPGMPQTADAGWSLMLHQQREYETEKASVTGLAVGRSTPETSRAMTAEPTTSDYCINMRRPPASSVLYHNVYWQRLTSKSPPKDLVVYSAFYDTRPAVGLIPVVRILAVMQGYNDSTVIHCQLWYADENRQPLLVIANVLRTGRGHKIGKVLYGQYMFTCPMDAQFGTLSVIPSHVSLAFERCAPSTTFIPIEMPFAAPVSDSVESRAGASFAHEFGMCVAIAFGKTINDQWLIEWFELHAILGVTEINVYNATLNVSAATNDVIAFYQRTGLLRVFQMPPPVNGTDIDAVKLASPASLNDCLMRNMYRYRHTVVVDFDEVILPRMHLTYSDLVLALNRLYRLNDTYYSYAFRNAFFLLDFPTVPPIIKDLRGHDRPSDREVIEGKVKGNDLFLVRQRGRAPVSRFLYSAKSFVNPRNCLSVFNHYCYVPFSANETLSNAPRVVDVHQSFAQVHHYRLCNRDKMQCSNMLSAPERDDAILAFSDKLSQRVQHVRSMLNI